MAFDASQHTYSKVCLGSNVLSLFTHSAQLCFVKTSSVVGYAFPGYTQVFFPLPSLSSSNSILFVFFLSSVLCLLNSSTVFSSFFLPTVVARWDFIFPHGIKVFCCTTTEVQSGRGCSHDNLLSSTPLMLGTLVPCQYIDRLNCILGISR